MKVKELSYNITGGVMINEIELDNQDYEVDEVIDNNKLMAYDIAVFYNTYNLSTLMKWWGKKLIVPDFQRANVWNIKKASEFVDSILRGLPVPSMFIYDDMEKNRYLVVDGQQRLNSLYSYIKRGMYGDSVFRLVGNIHPNWTGRTFEELDQEDKDRLEDTLLNITVMRQIAPDDGQSSMYLAFQRINTGGIALTAQEIRMAVSYGELARYINQLSADEKLRKWDFLRSKNNRTFGNYSQIQELLLKFWAYYFNYPKQYTGSSTREFLDVFFDQQKDFDKPKKKRNSVIYHSKEEFIEVFDAAFDEVIQLSVEDLSPYTRPAQTFLEAIWVGLTYRKLVLGKSINSENLSSYIKNWKYSIGEEKFSELFQARRTSSIKSAYERINAGIEYFSGEF